jgi:hypothetical protein
MYLWPGVASGDESVDIVVSADDNNRVYRRYWRPSTGWTGWGDEGAPVSGVATWGVSAAWKRGGKAFDIFAVTSDGKVNRKSWTSSGGFKAWESLGAPSVRPDVAIPAATWRTGGQLDVFVQNKDTGTVWWTYLG